MIPASLLKTILLLGLSLYLSGCVTAVVATAIGVTTTAIGGAIDVADAVTPDIFDDDDDEDDGDDDDEEDENDGDDDMDNQGSHI